MFIMFKVEKEEMVNKTFRLPLKLVEKLYSVAQNQGVSLNNLVKQCCEYALENLDSQEKQPHLNNLTVFYKGVQ